VTTGRHTYLAALDALERGRAAVRIDGAVLPVVGVGRHSWGQAVVDVAIGDKYLELELNGEVEFVDLDEDEMERSRR
jgi:hypothetical protein